MELRHLRYFVAVAEELSFTKAAQKLRIAQPSLTRQVRNLEDEIGVRLLDRSNNRVALTVGGAAFFLSSQRILSLAAEGVAEVQRVSSAEAAHLSIGYVADVHSRLLPATLGAFRKAFPHVTLNLFDLTRAEQFQALEGLSIDLGFVGLSPAFSGHNLQSEKIATDTVMVALPIRHPLAKSSRIELLDLATQFFIGMSARTHPGARAWLLQTCRDAGFAGRILQEADGESAAMKFVADGLGVALIAEHITGLPHEGVVFRPLSPPLYCDSTMAWRADNLSTPLKDYLVIVRELSAHPPQSVPSVPNRRMRGADR